METNQESLLTDDEKREKAIRTLEQNIAMFRLQAEIAECRMRIKKANLEEILFAAKIEEMRNPPKNEQKS